MGAKQEIFQEELEAYLSGSKEEKGRILDAVSSVTGCHRKAAIRRFRTLQMRHVSFAGGHGRKETYGLGVTASGSEFINWHMKGWCDSHTPKIEMTRTRPYMKNDHARIEQKNYANVRHIVGYTRLDDPRRVLVLNELYDALEDYINFFVPSMKCVRKERIRSRTVRVYDKAQTAYERMLAYPDIAPVVKEKLRQKYATLNPKILKQKCDRNKEKLFEIRPRLR